MVAYNYMEMTIIKINKENFIKEPIGNEFHPMCKNEILKAYSIVYTELIEREITYVERENYTINESLIEIPYDYDNFMCKDNYSSDSVKLYVYYYGIKDEIRF